MADSLAAPLAVVVLAAGAGTRLRPLTSLCPKPLCPVGDRTLLDWSLGAVAPLGLDVAVNVHHGAAQIVDHIDALARPVVTHVSHEQDRALGTAGAIGRLRDWLGGRGALVVNADTWHRADLAEFLSGWDGERVRLLSSSPLPFGPGSGVVASIVPWSAVEHLTDEPTGLWEVLWNAESAAGRLDAVHHRGVVVDCGTPAAYLAANLAWSGGESVLGAGATVDGSLTRCVVWPGSVVAAGEVLVDAVRADGLTVLVR
ncbi:MAG: sugar phosphate nucleotidyltransferase [Microthrixaceae bacterium]